MTPVASTTAEALRAALASTIACSAQELQEAVGQVVVSTAAQCPAAGPDERSLTDPATRTLVLLADRIPAGQEAQALAVAIERHYGRKTSQLVLGERSSELIGEWSEAHQPRPTTPEEMRSAIANFVQFDAQQLHARVGNILVVPHSREPQYKKAIGRTYAQSRTMALYDDGDGEREPATVFFADRIPAGLEQRVFLRELMQLHGFKVNAEDWNLVRRHAASWDTWGGVEGRIHKNVMERFTKEAWHGHADRDLTQLIFTVQEAVRQRVEPVADARGAPGWLHAVFETVRGSVKSMLGVELQRYGSKDFVSLLQIGSPFGVQIDAMDAHERSRRERAVEAERAAQRERDLDAKFEANLASPDCMPKPAESKLIELERRVAYLTKRLEEVVDAASDLDDVYLGPHTMNAALWDIKELVTRDATRDRVEAMFLQDLAVKAEAGLVSAVGTIAERDALKELLRIARPGAESGSESWDREVSDEVMSAVLNSLSRGSPYIVEKDQSDLESTASSREAGPTP